MTAPARSAGLAPGAMPTIGDSEFRRLRDWLEAETGIHLTAAKSTLVTSRLAGRLRERGVATFTAYLRLVEAEAGERQAAIDLLTTNETYFFREPRHFEFLQSLLPAFGPGPARVWSAACSSGEEAYSIAMLLEAGMRGRPWEVFATDISSRVLQRAATGHYRLDRAGGIPKDYLARYCLRGTGSQAGTLLVSRALRDRVRFEQANLTAPLPAAGEFDVIFLRNVMIYFDVDTKRDVVERLVRHLRPGGHLLIGHSESLTDVTRVVQPVAPAIYRKA